MTFDLLYLHLLDVRDPLAHDPPGRVTPPGFSHLVTTSSADSKPR